MNVSLTPELERYVRDRVASRRYATASEVVREALRKMQASDEMSELNESRSRANIQQIALSEIGAPSAKELRSTRRQKKKWAEEPLTN